MMTSKLNLGSRITPFKKRDISSPSTMLLDKKEGQIFSENFNLVADSNRGKSTSPLRTNHSNIVDLGNHRNHEVKAF
jgi:hypothetical protein